jgi:hypothetical protein
MWPRPVGEMNLSVATPLDRGVMKRTAPAGERQMSRINDADNLGASALQAPAEVLAAAPLVSTRS